MQIWEFENAVLSREGVRIVIRAKLDTAIGDYDFQRSATDKMSIAAWLDLRVYPRVRDYQVSVFDGSGVEPNRNTHMSTIRETYRV